MRGPRFRRILAGPSTTRLLALFVAFALFPLFWLFKVSITPNDLLYSEGVRMWPSRTTLEHYARSSRTPISRSSSATASSSRAPPRSVTTLVAAAAGYAFSRFIFRGKFWIVGLMLVTQMFPLVMIVAPIFRLLSPLGLTNSLTGPDHRLHGLQRAVRQLPDAVLLRRHPEGARGGRHDRRRHPVRRAAADRPAADPARASPRRSASSSPPPGANCCSP